MKFKELKRLIRISPLRNSTLYHALRFEMKKKECDKVICKFLGGGHFFQSKRTDSEEYEARHDAIPLGLR